MSENFSYSKLDTFQQCGYRYKLKYVDGHYISCDSIATELGTAIHACEEAIAKAIQAGEKIDYVKLKNDLLIKMYELKFKYPTDFVKLDKANKTYSQKIYAYVEKAIYNLEKYFDTNKNLRVLGMEQEFNYKFNGYTFHGFIDRVFQDINTGELIIQDIKTYAVPVDSAKLKVPLQFVVYCLAAKELYDCDYSKMRCEYYLPFCELTQQAGTINFIETGKEKLIQIFADIEAKEFKPNQSPLCHYCEFCITNPAAPLESKFLCPYHSLWTKENKSFKTANEWQGLEYDDMINIIYKKELGL